MHEDATGLISVYGQRTRRFHNAADKSIQHYLSFNTELTYCMWICHARSLNFFHSVVWGHPGPRETTAVPSCHCPPGRASRPGACNFPPSALGCVIFKQREEQEQRVAPPPQRRSKGWAPGPLVPVPPPQLPPSLRVTVGRCQHPPRSGMEERDAVSVTRPVARLRPSLCQQTPFGGEGDGEVRCTPPRRAVPRRSPTALAGNAN